MGGPYGGLVGFLEADISRGDYNSAVVLWKSLKQQGAISTALEAALTSAIQQFNLGELGAALTAHNQAQN
jgi:RimJ/RimL family protein N-acetyltransferase